MTNDSMFQDPLVVRSNRILYTASSFARANLIHLQEIGESQALKAHISKREGLTSYLFFIVLDGSGVIGYNGMEYHLHKGNCVFIDCKKSYFQGADTNNLWRIKWAHFYGSNMNGIYDKYLQRGGLPCFSSRYLEKYECLLDELFMIAASDLHIRDMKLYEKLTSLLTLLMEESWDQINTLQNKRHTKRQMQPIKDFIDQHYHEKITLEELSAQFYINKFYLTRVFKEQYGISINNYIQELRITRAKQLLRFTELSIEEVGRACGIVDGNYFSRVFKKVEDVSPGEFRRMWVK